MKKKPCFSARLFSFLTRLWRRKTPRIPTPLIQEEKGITKNVPFRPNYFYTTIDKNFKNRNYEVHAVIITSVNDAKFWVTLTI